MKGKIKLLTAYRLLPTDLCLPPTAYRPLPTAYCLPPTAYRPLPTAYCLLPTAYCYRLLPTAHCVPPTAYRQLPTDLCLPPSASKSASSGSMIPGINLTCNHETRRLQSGLILGYGHAYVVGGRPRGIYHFESVYVGRVEGLANPERDVRYSSYEARATACPLPR